MRGSVSLGLDTSFLWDIKRCSTNLYDVVTLVPSLLVLVIRSERRSRSDVLLWDSCTMRVWIRIMWILYIVCIPFMWSMFKIYHREDKKSDLPCPECQSPVLLLPCPRAPRQIKLFWHKSTSLSVRNALLLAAAAGWGIGGWDPRKLFNIPTDILQRLY